MRLFESLTREARNDEERQLLANTLLSRQQEKNEKIIHEQGRLIDTLNSRWQRLDNELAKANSKNRKKITIFLLSSLKELEIILSFLSFLKRDSWKKTREAKKREYSTQRGGHSNDCDESKTKSSLTLKKKKERKKTSFKEFNCSFCLCFKTETQGQQLTMTTSKLNQEKVSE